MLIDCPTCSRSYHVSRDDIGDGRAVVCSRCDTRWFVDQDGTSTMTALSSDLRTSSISIRPEARPLANPAKGYEPQPPLWRRARPLFAGATCLALAVGTLGAREQIVRAAPRTAGLYALMGLPVNVRGLEIAALSPDRPASAPGELKVSGEIRNIARKRVVVPRLSYQVRDAAGKPLMSWTETAPSRTLGAGKMLPFVSSPRPLPADGHIILVRFGDADTAPPVRIARRTN